MTSRTWPSAEPLDGVFLALSDPTRRAVVGRLGQGAASVSELAQPFEMGLPAFMKHVRVLESCGVVRTEKQGRVRICVLEGRSISEAETWLARQRAAWEAQADRLVSYVENEQEEVEGDRRRQ